MGAREGKRSGLLWLLLFGAAFLLLSGALALAIGFDSARVPPGAVVVVEGVPGDAGVVGRREFEEMLKQQATYTGAGRIPPVGSPRYEELKDAALSELITIIWLTGQGEELGIEISERQIDRKLRETGEVAELVRSGNSLPALKERVKLDLLQEEIRAKLEEEAPEPSNPQPYFSAIDFRFPGEWAPRTRCRDGFIVALCSGYVAGHPPGPCYEADPQEPTEECPAPVLQRQPGAPGSFTPRQPWGAGLPQGPIPG